MSVYLKKISLVLLCLLLVQGLALTGAALAQEEPPERPPLPPLEGGNGGDDDDDDDVAPGPPGASVSGYVYDYSTVVHPGGVPVVLNGGGWQAETLTDSRGYYRFDGLGSGSAVLNLRLPPGAHPVVFDWPLWLGPGANLEVNLGFYWGKGDLLPVIVSGSLHNGTLVAEVANRMDHPLTGGELQVILPAGLRGGPAVKASQGFNMSSYDAHELQLKVGELAGGESATVEVPVSAVGAPGQAAAEAQLIFTFDRQQTPFMAVVKPQAGPAQADTPVKTAAATPQASAGANPPASSGAAGVRPPTPPAPHPPAAQAGRPASPLPETGANSPAGPAPLTLAALLAVLLAAAGLRSLHGWNR